LTSKVALEETEIGTTGPIIVIFNSYTDEQPHLGIPWGNCNYDDEGDESDEDDSLYSTSGNCKL
jgi:hypothetical protein